MNNYINQHVIIKEIREELTMFNGWQPLPSKVIAEGTLLAVSKAIDEPGWYFLVSGQDGVLKEIFISEILPNVKYTVTIEEQK